MRCIFTIVIVGLIVAHPKCVCVCVCVPAYVLLGAWHQPGKYKLTINTSALYYLQLFLCCVHMNKP